MNAIHIYQEKNILYYRALIILYWRNIVATLPMYVKLTDTSISLRRLNGADEDGDRVLVINNNIIKSGINRNLPIVN